MYRIVGVPLPPPLQDAVRGFCDKRGFAATVPHIPVIHTPLPGKRLPRQKLESFCLSWPPFRVTVARPGQSGDMLYLTVMPGQVNMLRESLCRYLGFARGRKPYRPHVPLLCIESGGPQAALERYLEDARRAFTEPVTFDADTLTIYESEEKDGVYEPALHISLTGR